MSTEDDRRRYAGAIGYMAGVLAEQERCVERLAAAPEESKPHE